MGCTPSKTVSTVHPIDSNTNGILQVQEVSPDAPSTTPRQVDPNSHCPSGSLSPTPQSDASLASELQQRLQSHVSNRKEQQKPLYQPSVDNNVGNDCVNGVQVTQVGDSTKTDVGGVNDSAHPDTNTGNNNMVHSVRVSENERSIPSTGPPNSFRPGPKPGRHPLQLQYGTDSQVEFFKTLEKRINEGPDYEPNKKQRTSVSSRDS